MLANKLNTLEDLDDLLTDGEKRSIDDKGYVVFEKAIEPEMLQKIRIDYEMALKKAGFLTGRDIKNEGPVSMGDLIAQQFTKDHRVGNLANKGAAFDGIYTNPKSLSAVKYILETEFQLSSLDAVEALPERGEQELRAEDLAICVWLLDDYSESSGTIRVRPSGSRSTEALSCSEADEQPITAPAGSIIVLKPNVWFGETANNNQKNRRAIYASFISRDREAQINQLEFLRRSTFLRLSPFAKYMLNV
jgi:hypothetical protein